MVRLVAFMIAVVLLLSLIASTSSQTTQAQTPTATPTLTPTPEPTPPPDEANIDRNIWEDQLFVTRQDLRSDGIDYQIWQIDTNEGKVTSKSQGVIPNLQLEGATAVAYKKQVIIAGLTDSDNGKQVKIVAVDSGIRRWEVVLDGFQNNSGQVRLALTDEVVWAVWVTQPDFTLNLVSLSLKTGDTDFHATTIIDHGFILQDADMECNGSYFYLAGQQWETDGTQENVGYRIRYQSTDYTDADPQLDVERIVTRRGVVDPDTYVSISVTWRDMLFAYTYHGHLLIEWLRKAGGQIAPDPENSRTETQFDFFALAPKPSVKLQPASASGGSCVSASGSGFPPTILVLARMTVKAIDLGTQDELWVLQLDEDEGKAMAAANPAAHIEGSANSLTRDNNLLLPAIVR